MLMRSQRVRAVLVLLVGLSIFALSGVAYFSDRINLFLSIWPVLFGSIIAGRWILDLMADIPSQATTTLLDRCLRGAARAMAGHAMGPETGKHPGKSVMGIPTRRVERSVLIMMLIAVIVINIYPN